MEKIKIGFLPFYIKLYDDCGSGAKARPRLEPFARRMANELAARGFDVVLSDFCRIKSEFSAALSSFEAAGCRAVVTWHAAYSPSLESIDALNATRLPIIVLDTTETYAFDSTIDPGEISYCHGIHGVMDVCSLLRHEGIPFAVAAGHADSSDVLDRTAGYLRAAVAATSLRGSRTGSIGGSFDGMGDFLVSDEEMLSRFGVSIVYPGDGELASYLADVKSDDVADEIAFDNSTCFEIEPVPHQSHVRTARNCLAVRRWIKEKGLSAFTANFREIRPETGLEIMPFMEATKAMGRGIGYAGEGDVLTASLVGALMHGFPDTAFIEIFCPDWKGNTLLISHMGEYNPRLISGMAGMKEIPFIYGDARDPVVSYGCYRGGEAVFCNLYRAADGFRLFISPVEMLEIDGTSDRFTNKVRGWMRPYMPVSRFLEELSRAGATHHSALVYGAGVRQIEFFADLLRLPHDTL